MKTKTLWKEADFHPEDSWTKTGRVLLYKARWGWKILSMGQPDKIPCAGPGLLFKKHLYRSNGKCRRCGIMKADERDFDKGFKKVTT